MIIYVIRFSLSLVIVYVFYKAFFENEKGHGFKRLVLLGGLATSLVVPLVSIDTSESIKSTITAVEPYVPTNYFFWEWLAGAVYLLVVAVLLVRFGVDIYRFLRKAAGHEQRRYGRATVVLLTEDTTPYSFLHYIFINKAQFEAIPPELLKHELTHVQQWHTLDIFLVELVKVLVWINPMVGRYKKAMQLNHEFLADGDVLRTHDTRHYQNILLSYLDGRRPLNMVSGFNFSPTKQRFQMMTRGKSSMYALKQVFIVPLLAVILISCSDNPGVSGKEMLYYWRYTAGMQEILETGEMSEKDLKEGILLPIETKGQYDTLMAIYKNMSNGQRTSVYKLPAYLEPLTDEDWQQMKQSMQPQ
ncbi:M56 family metallopeptidase [uncultured Imperialibacter sp.]|uniref:M56 family metallopeptidase n=1 Tax=uncultured Imperialibacter sp. TaxID=1672639 RepID=UPI0030DA8A9C|tara:strand:- start:47548 stop:48624 length:1077 start_codon:yes stop_codon:yes gene_type:complete